MKITIDPSSTPNEVLSFTIDGVDVSVVNALRRTLLSDIQIWGIYQNINFHKNTTKLINEILQNRISCIPVHLPIDFPDATDLEINLSVANTSNSIVVVTSQNFTVINKKTNEVYVSQQRGTRTSAQSYAVQYR